MKISNTITKLLTIATGVTAMAFIGFIWMAEQAAAGQSALGDGSVRFISSSIGLVSGQTLRISVVNPNAPERGGEPVRAQTCIYDSTGRLIAKTEETSIPAGQFRSFDFNRDDLPLSGEAGTGRLQLRGVVQVSFSDGSVRTLSKSFPVSMEVIDNRSGSTNGGDYYTGTVTVSSDG